MTAKIVIFPLIPLDLNQLMKARVATKESNG
jgi:hypothetical protein